ncbi:unnamed protein product [Parnassius apollo]|uniref:(apollo) hypothetical protein n=1 Tax=Parnassius apollo TaxID=110799 RepID=A0A8S3X6S6_PARAO|nr:unnamed protein product [Parnassius apollo]
MGETCPAETFDDSDCIQDKRPVSKKKKTCDDENLVQVLKESIAIREERERKQESDSDRLFMLSLLEDFKNIPKHRKLSTRMELIDVIKRAQMPFMETYNSEFGVFRQGHVDYEPGTSTARLFRPETSVSEQYRHGYSTEYEPGNSSSRQYRHEYSTEYRPEISSSGQYRHGYSTQSNYGPEASSSESRRAYSTSVADKQDNTGYTEVLSPSDTNVTDTSQNSELLELFQGNSLP